MATFATQTKNTSTYSNQAFGTLDMTWAEALFDWDSAESTWAAPRKPLTKLSKNSSVYSNQAKN
jgi:hypothetical protein